MKILVIGGTGHIGSYLVPRLTQLGHAVSVIARHPRPQYTNPLLGWKRVRWILADRTAEEATGAWAQRMSAIESDVVIDLTCFTPEQNEVMCRVFNGRIAHFIHCGTIWAYGKPDRIPYEESFPRRPITDYGRRKARIESDLIEKHRADSFPATIIHPGHISGRRWLPIDPQGSRNGVAVYEKLAHGAPVTLPDQGTATLHHVHGDDVAQLFELAVTRREAALGESFSAVAPYALSLADCCKAVASLFGREPNLQFVPLSEMDRIEGAASAAVIQDHVLHSPWASIAKPRRVLGYAPRYTTEQIYAECLDFLIESGQLNVELILRGLGAEQARLE